MRRIRISIPAVASISSAAEKRAQGMCSNQRRRSRPFSSARACRTVSIISRMAHLILTGAERHPLRCKSRSWDLSPHQTSQLSR
jgi:hypothetical protein